MNQITSTDNQREVLVYGRQSLGEKDPIQAQLDECTEDLEENLDLEVDRSYTDGVSASEYSDKERPEYELMKKHIATGTVGMVSIWEASRISREVGEWDVFLKLCRAHKTLIRVMKKGRTYDPQKPSDRTDLHRDAVSAVEFSDERSYWAKRGIRTGAKLGRPPAGPVPRGYKRLREAGSGDLLGWEVDDEWAQKVAEIFAAVATNANLAALERKFGFKNNQVQRMIRNPAYIAERRYTTDKGVEKVYPGKWKPLVDKHLWLKANRVLNSHKAYKRPDFAHFLLTTTIRCGWESAEGEPCRHTLKGGTSMKRGVEAGRYGCYKGHVWIDAEETETLVLQMLSSVLAAPEFRRLIEDGMEADSAEVEALDAQIDAEATELEKVKTAYKARKLDLDIYIEFKEEAESTIKRLRQKRQKLTVPTGLLALIGDREPGAHNWGEGIADALTLWGRFTDMELKAKRQVIREVLDIRALTTTQAGGGPGKSMPVEERLVVLRRDTGLPVEPPQV